MMSVQIGELRIGTGEPVFVIAEIGVNHDGSTERALELVRVAKECGADAVKFQIFSADRLMHPSAGMAAYQRERCVEDEACEMLKKYEMSLDALQRVCGEARALGLVPLATPFSCEDVETIEKLGLPAIKIASPDLVNRPLLQRAAQSGRAMIVSTGAATMLEVTSTLNWLRDWHASVALLHCVSSYPTPAAAANLSWIDLLIHKCAVPVGFSDHTTEPLAGALAVAAGASIVEKHLTYDRAAPGPDHSASADPGMFAEYVRSIRLAQAMRGEGSKRVLDVERDVRQLSRQSLVLKRDVEPGERIVESDLTVQRPGTGIAASMIRVTVGRRVLRRLEKGTMLRWDMLSDAA